ncbi:MAG: TlyA family RNA methyltransferase [Candidatus Gracilibacteria bacterium]|nr:TlyA family RNA methyltransferase [Candidatus Gracilibacteria bacterium]
MRLDVALAERYSFTRNKAQQLIALGLISVNGKSITKTSFEVTENDVIDIEEDRRVHWVSRSAEKLIGFLEKSDNEKLLQKVSGSTCLDVGASTGGFTQVLLEYNAAHVDAVDVGTNQLHETIRNDARVTSYEETDIRDFTSMNSYGIIVCDASFISLIELFSSICSFADRETDIILLFKPQFEVGKEHLRKTGVPKDEKSVQDAMNRFEKCVHDTGCEILQKEKSTLVGEAGNQEWVYWIQKR